MAEPTLELRLSARLFSGGEKCFGPGVAALLEGTDRHGSLQAAAGGMGMAYSKAWTTLRRCEEVLGFPLLARKTGGPKGGSSRLTGEARRLLTAYREMQEGLEETRRELEAAFNERIRKSEDPGVGGQGTAGG